jgi:hypothetical protein
VPTGGLAWIRGASYSTVWKRGASSWSVAPAGSAPDVRFPCTYDSGLGQWVQDWIGGAEGAGTRRYTAVDVVDSASAAPNTCAKGPARWMDIVGAWIWNQRRDLLNQMVWVNWKLRGTVSFTLKAEDRERVQRHARDRRGQRRHGVRLGDGDQPLQQHHHDRDRDPPIHLVGQPHPQPRGRVPGQRDHDGPQLRPRDLGLGDTTVSGVSEWDANGEALSQNTTVLIANVGTASNSATSTSHDFLSTSSAPDLADDDAGRAGVPVHSVSDPEVRCGRWVRLHAGDMTVSRGPQRPDNRPSRDIRRRLEKPARMGPACGLRRGLV